MQSKRIDGTVFENMLRSGRNNLANHEAEVNALNVFPVADGDTGINMRLTLDHGLRYAKSSATLGAYLKGLGDGMLLGARGNSGVILSQIFYGFSQALAHYSTANAGEFRNSIIRGYRTAYKAVMHPVEGTILTVSREGVENIKSQIGRDTTVEQFLAMYAAEMRLSLKRTPDLLPVLKQAGVIDSGAYGFILIMEGMQKYLAGEPVSAASDVKEQAEGEASGLFVPTEEKLAYFDGTTPFEDGYCMEFLLQLMKSPEYNQEFQVTHFIKELEDCGNSIVCVQNGTKIKVHIHTKRPAKIILLAQIYGEFLAFKLENMQLQHNEHIDKVEKPRAARPEAQNPEEQATIGFVAVVDGEGVRKAFSLYPNLALIDGGASMNTSSQEFLDAMNSLNAAHIVVFPNNKNNVRAANQAVELSGLGNVTVIPTETVPESYYAMAIDVPTSTDYERRMENITETVSGATTLLTATASKQYETDRISVQPGEFICVYNDEVVSGGVSECEAIGQAISEIEGIDEKESCMVFTGEGVTEEEIEALTDYLYDEFGDINFTFMEGNQHVYRYMFGFV